MLLLTYITTSALFIEQVYSLNLLSIRKYSPEVERKDAFNQIIKDLKYLIASRRDGRKFEPSYLQKTKLLYDSLKKDMSTSDLKQWLRQHKVPHSEHQAGVSHGKGTVSKIIEKELKQAVEKKSSALLDRPYLQKDGRNDYLVINPEAHDPFGSVIPNDIYYNHEKKCVNWLEDCNAQGIRAVLLQKIRSPYK